jgi:SpoVK/Ycf46/Vps4 family AAA+-type ATPase
VGTGLIEEATVQSSREVGGVPVHHYLVARIRARARARIMWLRRLWAATAREGEAGMAIAHSEIDRVLLDPIEVAAAERTYYATNDVCLEVAAEIAIADSQLMADSRWRELCEGFELEPAPADLLSLAVAAELDPDLRRVYGYLGDEPSAMHPTAQVAVQLFGWTREELLRPLSTLFSARLLRAGEGQPLSWSATTQWTVDPQVVAWLMNGDPLDPALTTRVELVRTDQAHGLPCLYPELLSHLVSFVEAIRSNPVTVELVGPEGAGKRVLAEQLAFRLRRNLLVADASALLRADMAPAERHENLIRILRSARLADSVLYLHHADAIDIATPIGLARRNDETWIVAREASLKTAQRGATTQSFRLPTLRRSQRLDLWSRLSSQPAPAPVADWLLTPADIESAASAAPAGPAAVVESCRWVAKTNASELFSPLPCPYTWSDMVLAPSVERHLGEFEAQARLRWQVYEDWGFGSLCPLGRGITALFAGPSGSGKTMSAQVLARSLSMDLYRVDLAGVVNKYIGETEKRLRQVFEACERSNVLLLFDEADALFGQRTQVRDAHDRFANIEIDYLLQRMEQFDGIAILATNRKGDLDRAFVRRLRFIVDFVHPGPQERRILWWKSLVETPSAGESLLDTIDWDYLAQSVVLSAAEIKQAALAAAFLACDEGSRIGMRHLVAASRRELAKQGIELRGGLGA